MTISMVASSTGVNATSVAVTLPSGTSDKDMLILVVETSSSWTQTLTGWDKVVSNVLSGTGSNSTYLNVLIRRYASGDTMPTLTAPANHIQYRCVAYTGVLKTGTQLGAIENVKSWTTGSSSATVLNFTLASSITVSKSGKLVCGSTTEDWVSSNDFVNYDTPASGITSLMREFDSANNTIGDHGQIAVGDANIAAGTYASGVTLLRSSIGTSQHQITGFSLNLLPDVFNITGSGTLKQFTASVALHNPNAMAISASIKKFTASVNLLDKDGVSVAATLPSLTGAATIDVTVGNSISVAASLHAFSAAVNVVELAPGDLRVAATMRPLSAAVDARHQDVSISAVMHRFSAHVREVQPIDVESYMQPFSAAVDVFLAPLISIDASLPPFSANAVIKSNEYRVDEDIRELILARLAVVLGGLGASFGRNDPELPDTALPKITMMDSDEDTRKDVFQRGRPASGPVLVALTPEVYLTCSGTEASIGPMLSAWEQTIRQAVLTDAGLLALVHDNAIEFTGSDSAVSFGRTALGQLSMAFTFWYVLATKPTTEPDIITVPTGVTSREQILSTLKQVIAQTEGVVTSSRNNLEVAEETLPHVILLDGSEDADSTGYGRGRPPSFTNRFYMQPEIYIVAEEDPTLAGPTLNRIRLMLLRGILNNPTLASLALEGDIRYEGCHTAMGAGRGMTGEMGMVISITRPSA